MSSNENLEEEMVLCDSLGSRRELGDIHFFTKRSHWFFTNNNIILYISYSCFQTWSISSIVKDNCQLKFMIEEKAFFKKSISQIKDLESILNLIDTYLAYQTDILSGDFITKLKCIILTSSQYSANIKIKWKNLKCWNYWRAFTSMKMKIKWMPARWCSGRNLENLCSCNIISHLFGLYVHKVGITKHF